MNFIYVYEENSDFKITIGEDDGYDYLFCDKESFNSLKAFVKEINNMADKSKAVNEIHVFNNGWSFIYDDCDLTLVRRRHFVFEKVECSNFIPFPDCFGSSGLLIFM